MKNTASSIVAQAKRGLSILIALVMLSSQSNAALAMDLGTGPVALEGLTIDDGGKALVAEPAAEPTIKETLLAVCAERGYGEDCAKSLLGMAWKESNFKADAMGDWTTRKGVRVSLAHGWFQIHYVMHGVTKECTEDLGCAARWTLTYMESNGYPKYPTYAVQCHNGCGIANGYAASALRHGQRLWKADDQAVVAVAVR